ncbi:CopG family transcriptional regulator [Geobacter sp. FeAm09]|uniref:CopG family transcriptional regulator n=1 Tax=Geobacter sp. FeAm09 TaxID=2597769 RepID=UPI0011EE679E|nr:CopG family transcriptional regulator [Geobacter sp. FeAm09]QEM69615.1 CopG family transcriptional regulator [Geobacter sp. FeAm09]
MTSLSLRIPDNLLHEVDTSAEQLHIPRAAYVRKALEQMNAAVAAERRRARLTEASLKVRAESMRVNAEFDGIEDAPHA